MHKSCRHLLCLHRTALRDFGDFQIPSERVMPIDGVICEEVDQIVHLQSPVEIPFEIHRIANMGVATTNQQAQNVPPQCC